MCCASQCNVREDLVCINLLPFPFAVRRSDLKLENCLVAHDGHLRLTDFGAAKDLMGDSKTTTFCGRW